MNLVQHKGWEARVILVRKCDVIRTEKSTSSASQASSLFSVSTGQIHRVN